MKKDVSNFLNPRTIAVIGASNDETKVGGILLKKLKFSRKNIFPVNNSADSVQGEKSFRSLLDIPDKIDLAIIAVPAQFVYSALNNCIEKKVSSVIIISAGFSELGKIEEERALISLAKKNGISILGPNCFGISNPFDNLDVTFSSRTPKKGRIAFISQSGALWSYISEITGFSGFISLGNQADLEFSDFIDYYSKDKHTDSILLYVEKIKDGNKFIDSCKTCINKGKKIYAVKSGKSEEGNKAAISHTGSLATDYRVYKGIFNEAGIILCDSIEEAVSYASNKKPAKIKNEKIYLNEAEIITNAGGAATLVSDYLSEKRIRVIGLKDVLGTGLSEDYLEAIKRSTSKNIIVILTPQYMTETAETAEVLISAAKFQKKRIIALFLGKESTLKSLEILRKNKIICFNSLLDFKNSLDALS